MFEQWFYWQVDACHDKWNFGLLCNDATYQIMVYFYKNWTGNEIFIQDGSLI